jgi:hypothetical protein
MWEWIVNFFSTLFAWILSLFGMGEKKVSFSEETKEPAPDHASPRESDKTLPSESDKTE